MIWDVQEKTDVAEEKATFNAQTVAENATKAAEIATLATVLCPRP